ncbi:MAG: biotin/lipoyl-binding protein [Coriobacteriales bacterium]|jgi:uncharacterized repeat protein (TIGR02543 family)|nr:biotin/lipoyl-binding protein [Coriobacteriales bacterium]
MEKVFGASRRRKWPFVLTGVVVLLITAIVVFVLFLRSGAEAETNIAQTQASVGDVSTTVSGSGTVAVDVVDVLLAYGVDVETVDVEVGDYVTKGDVLATLDSDSLNDAITAVEDDIAEVDELIASADTTETVQILAPLAASVMAINATGGDDAAVVSKEYGSVISLQLADGETLNLTNSEGTVADIYVSVGESVAADTALYSLSVLSSKSSAASLEVQRANLMIELQVLNELKATNRIVASTSGTVAAVQISDGNSLSASSAASENAASSATTGTSGSSASGGSGGGTGSVSANVGGGTGSLSGANGSTADSGSNSSPSTPTNQTYVLLYDLGGGMMSSGATNPSSYTSSYPSFALNNPSREGYSFIGWSAEGGIMVPVSEPRVRMEIPRGSKGDIVFTANWTLIGDGDSDSEDSPGGNGDSDSEDSPGDSEDSPGGDGDKSDTEPPITEKANLRRTSYLVQVAEAGDTDSQDDQTAAEDESAADEEEAAEGSETTEVDTIATRTAASYQGTAIQIESSDNLVLTLTVDELDISSLAVNQSATLSFDALSGSYSGTVDSINTSNASSDSSSGMGGAGSSGSSSASYSVDIVFAKAEGIYTGMSATASITKESVTGVLTVPAAAVQEYGDSVYVYTEMAEDGTLAGTTQITTGLSDGTTIEVTSGLSEGQVIYYAQSTGSTYASTSSGQQGGSTSFGMGGGGPSFSGSGDMPTGGGGQRSFAMPSN